MPKNTTSSKMMIEKTIIMMYGHPVGGKTTTAKILKKNLNCHLLQTCDIRRELYFSNSFATISSRAITHQQVYTHIIEQIISLTRNKNNIILDGSFKWTWQRKPVYRIVEQNGYQLVVIECVCNNLDVIKKRLNLREELGDAEAEGKGYVNYQYYWDVLNPIEDDTEYSKVFVNRLTYDTYQRHVIPSKVTTPIGGEIHKLLVNLNS
jgi:predicted kinase